ncbi:pyrroline-5-carboxylate reductase family protein [Zhaonella formicivorans]|uniref:pyrroline-5-carboxylate reductase family protein n=1 Tax=Zhaonella formicivorans TaxID=2528593 RepID=UPI0010EAD71C|nr:NAD(P)-binding domain-containing protein [Zhaonella formicivorans]
MSKIIGIMGAGRMGQALAVRLSGKAEILVNDVEQEKARELAKEVGGRAAELEELSAARMVILALPTSIMAKATANLKAFIRPGTLLINIATSCPKEVIIDVLGTKEQVVSVKFVGHAKEILAGENPTIVIDAPNEALASEVAELFGSMGKVVFGSEEIVAKLNVLGATEGIRAALRIKNEMEKLGLPQELYPAAVRGVAAGTMKAYASGDMGPFVQELVKQISAEMS